MTTMRDARYALAEAIENGADVRASAYQADNVNAPCAHVFRRSMDPRMVFSGAKSTYLLGVRLFASRMAEVDAQELLDEWTEPAGSTSVVAAIQNGANWAVDVDYAQVTQIGDVQQLTIGDETFLIVDLDVEVVY